ncbi:MucR family transcriptional regulator [Sphingobium cloacae]|uniref:MucR family transcriptional regulator n=1 Tax=Sphingobium cloacae TaxID=120107 RepID=A0A1E1F2F3_9SPHN|nr:MucR family transcriptional regulator [Sphingobium cloacae]BAV64697.1 MucR family transcriptional regulator [Sphingobium cloacae]
MTDGVNSDLNMLAVQLLSAYVANNTVPREDLVELIRSTRAALDEPVKEAAPPAEQPPVAAVSVRKSLASADHILSMIDGKPYKTLKRHLATHGMTPDEYRTKFGLPKTYPMVAPSYSERRRAVAKEVGLGQRRAESMPAAGATKEKTKSVNGGKAAPSKPRTVPVSVDTTAPVAPAPAVKQPKAAKAPSKARAPRKTAARKAD